MKITKTRLKELIKEELEQIIKEESPASVGSSDAKKHLRQRGAKDITSSGVNNLERGIILTLQKQLVALAKTGTLAPVQALLKQLTTKLTKLEQARKSSSDEPDNTTVS